MAIDGIYGPGRVPLIGQLQDGQPLAVPREGYLNLIHVSDIARAVIWLLQHMGECPLYLLSDGQPVLREDFYRHLAALCRVAEPEFIEADPNSTKLRRATDKRIDSHHFWSQSVLIPIYPDDRSGLKDSLVRRQT